MFTRIVRAVEVIAVLAFALMILLLFVRQPDTATTANNNDTAAAAPAGAQLYRTNCAGCHGASGQGGVGPQLNGGRVTAAFRTAADEIAFVTRGFGGMPSFERRLTAAEIATIVEFTRTGLPSK